MYQTTGQQPMFGDQAATELAGARVLVVDDDEAVGRLVCEILQRAQCQPQWAASAQAALDLVQGSFRPDLAILDVLMPGMNGLVLCRRLRDQSQLAGLPILILTAVQDDEVAAQALECGADDYLVKPMRWEGLLVKVQSLLRLARQQRLPSRSYHPSPS